MRPLALVLILVALGLAACHYGSTPRPVGERCGSDDDCAAGILCAYGLCRPVCSRDRDCPPGGVCVPTPSDPEVRVCTLDVEADCSGGTLPCPDGLGCAVDGRCRVECSGEGDCAALHSCIAGFCFEHGFGECGDAVCVPPEDYETCPEDCIGECGDDDCGYGEDPITCPVDCTMVCGDTFCSHSEDAGTCEADCPAFCPDGFCSHEETAVSCPADCD